MQESIEQEKVRVTPAGHITPTDAGKLLNRTPKTLANWRNKGWGPKVIMVCGRVFHDYEEVLSMARGEKPVKPDDA